MTVICLGVMVRMLDVGRVRDAGHARTDSLAVEVLNVGSRLTYGDLSPTSDCRFVAAAEQRQLTARSGHAGILQRGEGCPSIWASACQDKQLAGHACVCVVSWESSSTLPSHLCY